jgi:hypothetical protein
VVQDIGCTGPLCTDSGIGGRQLTCACHQACRGKGHRRGLRQFVWRTNDARLR